MTDFDPMYFTKDGVGRSASSESYQPVKVEGVGASVPVIVSPPNPSDIGVSVNVSNNLLFSSTSQEGNQGQIGDCYMLSPFNSLLDSFRRQVVLKNPDGTNSVIFRRNLLQPLDVRHDYLISASSTRPDPVTGACASCLLEKSYAYYRTGANTYSSLNFGWPGNVYSDLGCGNKAYSIQDSTIIDVSAHALLASLGVSICTFATIPSSIPIIGAHCYSVISVLKDASGIIWWKLRNPWGFDGAGSDQNPYDGVVTITHDQMKQICSGLAVQTDFPIISPVPSPLPPPIKADITVAGNNVIWWSTNASSLTINSKPQALSGVIPVDGSPKYDMVLKDLNGNLPSDGSGWHTAYPK